MSDNGETPGPGAPPPQKEDTGSCQRDGHLRRGKKKPRQYERKQPALAVNQDLSKQRRPSRI